MSKNRLLLINPWIYDFAERYRRLSADGIARTALGRGGREYQVCACAGGPGETCGIHAYPRHRRMGTSG